MMKKAPSTDTASANKSLENIGFSMKTNGHSNLDSTLRTPRVQHGNDTLFKIELALSRLENGD